MTWDFITMKALGRVGSDGMRILRIVIFIVHRPNLQF